MLHLFRLLIVPERAIMPPLRLCLAVKLHVYNPCKAAR